MIDDEPHILHYIRATLEAWGHTVVTASDGQAGLERAIAEPFDLIISDLRMPRTGGREFYETLLRQSRRRHIGSPSAPATRSGETRSSSSKRRDGPACRSHSAWPSCAACSRSAARG